MTFTIVELVYFLLEVNRNKWWLLLRYKKEQLNIVYLFEKSILKLQTGILLKR